MCTDADMRATLTPRVAGAVTPFHAAHTTETEGPAVTTSSPRTGRDDSRKADSPTEIRKPSWMYVLRKTVREFTRDDCTTLAARLTYYAVLPLFPAPIALASLLALVGQGEHGASLTATL